ncbi:MAG: hypothetical protein Q4D13_04230 [Erysipelotrichaceae bacterium]|nr:hypothetical protein [Erysipelotrichaceae bacterium]
MKKILIILLLLLCSGCSIRKDYYVFSFDNYSFAPGYDDLSFARMVYDFETDETIGKNETVETAIYSFGNHIADVKFTNYKNKEIKADKAILSEFDYFFDEHTNNICKLDGIELSSSIKTNCEMFNGEYIERNGTACVLSKTVNSKTNTVIFQGDIYATDQDKLYRIIISIE